MSPAQFGTGHRRFSYPSIAKNSDGSSIGRVHRIACGRTTRCHPRKMVLITLTSRRSLVNHLLSPHRSPRRHRLPASLENSRTRRILRRAYPSVRDCLHERFAGSSVTETAGVVDSVSRQLGVDGNPCSAGPRLFGNLSLVWARPKEAGPV